MKKGKMDMVPMKKSWLYMTIQEKLEITHDIAGCTIQIQPASTFLDVLKVVNNIIGE